MLKILSNIFKKKPIFKPVDSMGFYMTIDHNGNKIEFPEVRALNQFQEFHHSRFCFDRICVGENEESYRVSVIVEPIPISEVINE